MFKQFMVVLLVLAGVITTPAQQVTEETLLLNFIPNIQYAPFYVAQEAGFFEENGLQIAYEYVDEPIVVDLVASGENALGMVSGEQVILARAQGRPVTFVYEWYQQYPVGVVSTGSSEVSSVTDLTDVRVGIPGRFGASYVALTTMLESAGLTESDIDLNEIGYNAPEVICVGGVDASVVYVNNEPLQIRERVARGDCGDVTSVSVIPVSSLTDLVSNGIITNEDTLENRPELVTSAVAAFDEAVRLSISNPARAYLMSIDYIDNLPAEPDFVATLEELAEAQDAFLETDPDAEALAESRADALETLQDAYGTEAAIQFEVLLQTIDLWQAEQLGFSDAAGWENMQETLLSLGLIDEPIDLEAAFTNAYLPD